MATGVELLNQTLTTPEARANWQRWVAAHSPQVAMLDPQGEAAFQGQLDALNGQYMAQQNQNVFDRGQQQAAYTRQLLDMRRKFKLAREGMAYQANPRGLMGSGIWNKSLGQFDVDKYSQFANLRAQNQQALGGMLHQLEQYRTARDTGLANLRMGRAGQLMGTAIGNINQGLQ